MEDKRTVSQYLIDQVKRDGVNPINLGILTGTFVEHGFFDLNEQDIKDYLLLVDDYINKYCKEGTIWD